MLLLFFQIIVCILIADFLTGLVHWWEDTYGDPNWPVLGRRVIKPNLVHHHRPREMLKGGIVGRNILTLVLAAIVIGASHLLGFACWQVYLTSIIAAFGNEFHAWAHMSKKEKPKIITWLQGWLLISSKQHGWHHHAPYETYFCTVTNWLNPILEKLNFWAWVELIIEVEFGIKPLRGSSVRGGV